MKIEGEYTFDGPRDEVWKLVRDPDVLATCVLGIQSINKLNDNEFTGEIFLRLGPLNGVFGGRVIVSNEQPPASCTLTVEGTGRLGFLKGSGEVVLTEQADGKTLMKYNGELQIGGKVASVGQRLFDSVIKGIVKHGLDKLNEILKARSLTTALGPASQISIVHVDQAQVEQIERAEPVGQVGQAEPAERVEPVGQVEPAERVEPVGQVEQAEQVGQVEQAERVERNSRGE